MLKSLRGGWRGRRQIGHRHRLPSGHDHMSGACCAQQRVAGLGMAQLGLSVPELHHQALHPVLSVASSLRLLCTAVACPGCTLALTALPLITTVTCPGMHTDPCRRAALRDCAMPGAHTDPYRLLRFFYGMLNLH